MYGFSAGAYALVLLPAEWAAVKVKAKITIPPV